MSPKTSQRPEPWSIAGMRVRAIGGPFRRGAVDTLIDAGVEPRDEAALLGHSPITALRYRRRPGPEHLREAVRRSGLGALPIEADNVLELRPKR